MNQASAATSTADPLVEEVRAVRRAIAARVGDDFERLGDYVRKIGDEWRERKGRFAASSAEPAPESSTSDGIVRRGATD
jgi:hypothetical protein